MRALVALLLLVLSGTARAQTIETPAPFDSARRIVAITPNLAERLHLSAPVWPVQGSDYREARLYSVRPTGGFVLVVQHPDGSLERMPLSEAARTALSGAVDAAMIATGRPSGEAASDVISEPAGIAFARHQTFLAASVYGPLAASLVDDAAASGALYLGVTGMTFFVSYGASQSTPFTRAQSDLSGSLGLATAADGWLFGYAATGNSDKGVRAASLGAALIGTISGVNLGRSLSDAEAHAATFGIETVAAGATAVMSAVGAGSRPAAAGIAIAAAVGYPIGVRYPRHASYTVTAGDVEATSTAALIGVMVGGAALGGTDHPSGRMTAGFLASGYLVGALAGDFFLGRPYDFSQSQATIINVGAIAGAIVGGIVPVVARSDNLFLDLGPPAMGAMLGTAIVAGGFPTVDSGPQRVGLRRSTGPSRVHFAFQPLSLVAIAAGVTGRHVLGRLTF